MNIRRSNQRGGGQHGWLDTRHSFSFADYYDPAHMGFRSLRVINEDRILPGAGFPTHSHRDMEIISYLLEGALEHRDSMGTGSVIRPGEVQRMSAGTGVSHSEYNHSKTDGARFLQIWIVPQTRGLNPSYAQKDFGNQRHNRLCLVASQDGAVGSLPVAQDMRLWATVLDAGVQLQHDPTGYQHQWLQVANGVVDVNGHRLQAGDGAALSDEGSMVIRAEEPAELLVFDLT